MTEIPDRGPSEADRELQETIAGIESRLRAGERPAAVQELLARRLANQPPPRWIMHAHALLILQCPVEALNLLLAAARQAPQPDDIDLVFWQANALSAIDEARAEATYRSVLARDARHEGAAASLASMLRDQGRLNAACDVILALREAQGGGVEATLKCCTFLKQCRLHALEARTYADELARGSRDPRLYCNAGATHMLLGEFSRAREYLDQYVALESGPDHVAAVALWMAGAQKYASSDHPDFSLFRRLADDPLGSELSRVVGAFALAKACDDIGDFEQAARRLRSGNALHRSSHPWDAAAWDAFLAAECGRRRPGIAEQGGDGGQPVFVVGLLRTGTTLVEARLARHPQVRARGELDWLAFIHAELEAANAHDNVEALAHQARMYFAHLRCDDAPARWYVDKNPLNFRYLDLIAALLPGARIIHCVRDRRDTALSIWSKHLPREENRYAYDFGDIRRFAAGHDRLMERWYGAPRLPTLTVRYEDMIADPQGSLARIEAFLGLDPSSGSAAGGDAMHTISTASLWQARQPVYSSSVGRWRRYSDFLPELEQLA